MRTAFSLRFAAEAFPQIWYFMLWWLTFHVPISFTPLPPRPVIYAEIKWVISCILLFTVDIVNIKYIPIADWKPRTQILSIVGGCTEGKECYRNLCIVCQTGDRYACCENSLICYRIWTNCKSKLLSGGHRSRNANRTRQSKDTLYVQQEEFHVSLLFI